MKFINFAIVKFSIFLSLGIITAYYFPIENTLFIFCLPILFVFLIITWLISNRQLYPSIYFGLITYLCFFCIGFFSFYLNKPTFQSEHYSKFKLSEDSIPTYQLKIIEVLKPDLYNQKYLAKVVALNNQKSSGKILLHIRKDSLQTFSIDDILIISSTTQIINPPLNPGQFDYSMYMISLGVYDQFRISNREIIHHHKGIPSLKGRAEKTRNYLINKLKAQSFTTNELAVIQALALGQRKDISKDLYQDFAAAGAIHILAVSGLHVGIIYLILISLCKPLKRNRYGNYIITFIILICLWIYAYITGLSSSVLRAVTMFSFLAIARILDRETSSINTLFLSYLLLLLINPLLLFQVGFQLSYLAVFFIIWLVPLFNSWYYPKNKIFKYFWGILTVTLAAQFGVIPLSLYYFHQFPGLFFITNLLIIPVLSFLLIGCILIICLAGFSILSEEIVLFFNTIIQKFNGIIHWIANQKSFLIEEISFTNHQALFTYIMLVLGILFLKKKNYYNLMAFLSSIILLIGIGIWNKMDASENKLLIFHNSKHSLIAYQKGRELMVFKRDSSIIYLNSFPIKPYRVANQIQSYSEKELPQVFQFKNQNILIMDSLGVYPTQYTIDKVVLSNSPKVNLELLIDSVQPKILIADGSNYKSYVMRWKKTCEEKNLTFHYTGTDGAFLIN